MPRQLRSEGVQPVAPLFSTPRLNRQRRAVSVLRRVRALVVDGVPLVEALLQQAVTIEREFARAELLGAGIVGVTLDQVDYWGDLELRLWLVDRAIAKCRPFVVHRGGHHVTRGAA